MPRWIRRRRARREPIYWQTGAQIALYGAFEPSGDPRIPADWDAYGLAYLAMRMMGYGGTGPDAILLIEEGVEDWRPHADGLISFVQLGWSYRHLPPLLPAIKCVQYATSVAGQSVFDGIRVAFPINPSDEFGIYAALDWIFPARPSMTCGRRTVVVDVAYRSTQPDQASAAERAERLFAALSYLAESDWVHEPHERLALGTVRAKLSDIDRISAPSSLPLFPTEVNLVDWSEACRMSFLTDSVTMETAAVLALVIGSLVHRAGLDAQLELAISFPNQ